ncbi:hypothetical protein ASF49_11340 [Methylobacterium sp. Leaf104]|uniref:hypothetical protein n=1 Tax=Methylobacterium TaxID=407 RepID=UPI0006F9E87C|nr:MULTISPECIES: hypothetical protein [Methylobacterium]KQP31160.1 hypothetical protein ASF49_11340 [Methylobacterium sp. Leaf104]MCI9881251.1 hypothetical protein [Methylobacterium goesingense]
MIESPVREIEQVAQRGTSGPGGRMLRRLSMLFTERAEGLHELHVEAFDAVMRPLTRSADGAARAALSDGPADLSNAPRAVVRDLALDADIAVARPVPQRSPRLAKSDLVTDVLAARGDTETVQVVAGNAGASFSALAERARVDAVLRAMLESRAAPAGRTSAVVASPTRATGLPRPSEDDERRIKGLIRHGEIDAALAEVARPAEEAPQVARRAYEAADHDPLLFLLRAIRFGFGTLKLFPQTKPGPPRRQETWAGIQTAFQALSVTTAQRVMRLSAQPGGEPNPPRR